MANPGVQFKAIPCGAGPRDGTIYDNDDYRVKGRETLPEWAGFKLVLQLPLPRTGLPSYYSKVWLSLWTYAWKFRRPGTHVSIMGLLSGALIRCRFDFVDIWSRSGTLVPTDGSLWHFWGGRWTVPCCVELCSKFWWIFTSFFRSESWPKIFWTKMFLTVQSKR